MFKITYPEELPVSLRRDEIANAINQHQVVIVSGETGSGKTTQLPKICLELGRGRNKMIGHTQPRRLAATSVANRVAQELNTQIGEWVGYQIRFSDKSNKNTAIKLMTDGILLAQTQRDPLLSQYDTIIIDEAHERSLNIDFLLGFLKQLLPRRPDLKLIITSATIDAQRFARHFASNGKNAPVIDVTGRLYPVEILYRPILNDSAAKDTNKEANYEPDDEQDLVTAVVDAVNECCQYGSGDVLVFLPGEREIREAADALAKHVSQHTQILPLYARLSRAEQERIFQPETNNRRIVLATNVAETSLTVPGIRFVVDSGLARIKRYSWRNKVEQLRIEPISKASANQRAGRCGRIGPGVCIRLYDEDDFSQRDEFTDPEILRSSLAAVILRMRALRLQDIESFPFVDMPHGRAIADGYHILQELGALDDSRNLTKVGKMLARLPLDPRLARMILAAKDQHCLTEMLVIAAALSVQDPRERPMERRDAAIQAHAQFRDGKSEFMAYLKIWNWYNQQYSERESQRKFIAQLRKNFLSPARMREWRDIHEQLNRLVKQQRWRFNGKDATFEQIHTALLFGLLGNIGNKSEQGNMYLGARDIRFYVHPGSDLGKKAGRWIVAGELVETSRLFARCVANIDPRWVEKAGAHLLKPVWSSPRWDKNGGRVVANERATLYGLTVYNGRRVHYGRINPIEAREIFIREALVTGEINVSLGFIKHNLKQIEQIEKLEHKSRRPDILIDDELIYAFYDAQIPEDVYQTATLIRWHKGLSPDKKKALFLSRDDLMRHDAAGITTSVFPRNMEINGLQMALDYHFEPGSLRDGVTLSIPLFALNQVNYTPLEWLVAGMLKEKVQALLRTLPQRMRRHCVPIPAYAQGFYDRWFEYAKKPEITLLEALVQDIHKQCGIKPDVADFRPENLPAHLFMNFKIIDEHGRMLSGGRNLDQLKAEHQAAAQALFQEVAIKDLDIAQALDHEHLVDWTFGELPELLEIQRGKQSFIGYPALVDKGSYCDLDVFDDADEASSIHQLGLRRLLRLALKEQVRFLEKNLNDITRLGMLYIKLGRQDELRDQIINKAIEQACMQAPWPANKAEFDTRCEQGRAKLVLLAQEIARLVKEILEQWVALQKKMPLARPNTECYTDLQEQQQSLMHGKFVINTPFEQLKYYPRYLKAMGVRIDKLRTDPQRDLRWQAEITPLIKQYERARKSLKGKPDPKLDAFYWQLQELRVAIFAQELRTPKPVSVKRLQRAWALLQY